MSSRDQSLRPDTRNLSGTHGNFFGNPRAGIDSSQTPYQGFFTLESKCYRWEPCAREYMETCCESWRTIQRHNSIAEFARRPSTMNSFFSSEGPQNSMADRQRLQISERHFKNFPTSSTLSCWKTRFKTQISACSGFPSEAMLRMKEVEMVHSVDRFEIIGARFRVILTSLISRCLDARIASALNKIIQRSHFKKKVSLEEQKAQKEDGQGGCGPQGRSSTGGGGPRGFRTCGCAITLKQGGTRRGWRGGRINVLPWYRLVRVVSTSSETQGGKTGLPARVDGRHVVRGWQSSPIPECAQVTGKTGENGLYSGEMGGSSPWTRPSVPGCGDTLNALAGDQKPI